MKRFFSDKKYYILSALMPALILMASYALVGIYPFGDKVVLTSDLYAQLVDTINYAIESIRAGRGFRFSWETGLGINMYGMTAYTFFSPVNVILLFFDSVHMGDGILLVILIKYALTGLTASIYLAKSRLTGIKNMWTVAFACAYALATFNMNGTNIIMWMDIIAMLPVLLLGVEKIVDDGKARLFLVSVFICFVTNFYMSYIAGLFSIIYFVWYCVVSGYPHGMKGALKRFGQYAASAVIGILMAGIVIIPTIFNILQKYINAFAVKADSEDVVYNVVGGNSLVEFRYSFADLASKFFMGTYDGMVYSTPYLYVGMGVLTGVLLYFLNKKIHLREKIASGVVVLVCVLSLQISQLYSVWHGFRYNNGYEARFIFAFLLFFIILAVRNIINIEGINSVKIVSVGITVAVLALLSGIFTENDVYGGIVKSLIFVAVILFAMDFVVSHNISHNTKWGVIVALVMLAECFMADSLTIKYYNMAGGYYNRKEYMDIVANGMEQGEYLKNYDDSFYRVRSLNEMEESINFSLTAHYNSCSHFSSFANQNTYRLVYFLGGNVYSSDYRAYASEQQNVLLDSLLGVKYVLADKEEEYRLDAAYSAVGETAASYVYKNSSAFPLMFAASDEVIGYEPVDKNIDEGYRLDNLENFYHALFGGEEDIFVADSFEYNTVSKAKLNESLSSTTLIPEVIGSTNEEFHGSVTYYYTVSEEGLYYTKLEFAGVSDHLPQQYFKINDMLLQNQYVNRGYRNYFMDLGYYKAGEKIEFTIYSPIIAMFSQPRLFMCTSDTVAEYAAMAQEKEVEVTEYGDRGLTAHSSFNEDEFIFTTIPYDPGFTLYIDGEEAEIVNTADAFVGYYLTAGEHNIELVYEVPGLKLGMWVSVITVVMVMAGAVVSRKWKKER